MSLRVVFHVACASILAVSVARFVAAPHAATPERDAQADLISLLEGHGFRAVTQKPLVPPESALTFRRDGCEISVVFLPTIHRISLPARAALAALPVPPLYIHAGQPVPSLSAWDLIPRWLALRAMVNVQLEDETPWTSIALAVSPNQACAGQPPIDWTALR